MIKIRPSIFETNSSSNDYYNDYDDYYDNKTPTHATTHQLLRVILDWDPSVTESRKDEIIRDMETSDILYDIGDLMTFYEDELEEDPTVDDDTITFRFTVYMKVSWYGKYYPATRYSPAEYPEPEFEDPEHCAPLKNEPFPQREPIKKQIMELFAKRGYSEIIGIKNIYGEAVDEEEALSSIEDY